MFRHLCCRRDPLQRNKIFVGVKTEYQNAAAAAPAAQSFETNRRFRASCEARLLAIIDIISGGRLLNRAMNTILASREYVNGDGAKHWSKWPADKRERMKMSGDIGQVRIEKKNVSNQTRAGISGLWSKYRKRRREEFLFGGMKGFEIEWLWSRNMVLTFFQFLSAEERSS